MSHDLNPDEQPNDVLFQLTSLRMMSPNGEMPKKWHDGFWRVMDAAHAEIKRLRAENRALRTGRDEKEALKRAERMATALAIDALGREGARLDAAP